MTRRPASLSLTALAALAMALLVACSSSTTSAPSTSTTATSTTATPTITTIGTTTTVTATTATTATTASVTTTAPTTAAPTTAAPTTAVPTTVAAADVPAVASAGCSAAPVPTGESTEVLTVGQQAGSTLVHAPTGRSGPLPLVVDLHGYSEPNNVHALMTAMEAKGDVAGFVTVTPVITRTVPRWDTALDGPDMAFLSGLLDHVEATRCIDLARVYVSGLSNGAFMSSAVACALADRVAAVAPVAGLQLPDGCHPARPMPIISFHGTADRYVAYTGGLGPAVADLPSPDGAGTLGTGVLNASGGGPSVPDTEAAWARLDGCDATPETAKIADDVTLVHHHCPAGVDVELYSIDGGGHTWPGSEFSRTIEQIVGHTTFSVSATELIWQFFADHPRRNG